MPEKMFSGIKSDFLELCSVPGGKYLVAMTPFWKGNICDVISLKVEKANNLKFCMFTSIIATFIGTKFQINPLNLFSGSGPKSPPPPVAGEISKCRRL